MRLDLTALGSDPTPEQRADLLARARAGEFGPPRPVSEAVMQAIGVGVVTLFGASVFVQLLVAAGPRSPLGFRLGIIAVLSVLGLGCLGVLIALWRRALADGRRWQRLALFARANGLQFRRRSAEPRYPGLLFSSGRDRESVDHLWSPSGPLADAGTFRYVTGGGKNRTIHRSAFAAFRLPRPVPHLLLDAAGNNPYLRSNLPARLGGDQRVRLGAPFDEHYSLYAPAGYEQDAFWLLPPNLMQHLIDLPGTWDLELVDDWLFVYASDLDFSAPSTWQALQVIEATVVSTITRIADRYADERSLLTVADAPATSARPALTDAAAAAAVPTAFPGRPLAPLASAGRRLQRRTISPALLLLVAGVVLAIVYLVFLFR